MGKFFFLLLIIVLAENKRRLITAAFYIYILSEGIDFSSIDFLVFMIYATPLVTCPLNLSMTRHVLQRGLERLYDTLLLSDY